MAHVGKERAFKGVAPFGVLFGLAKGLFHPFLIGNDPRRTDELQRFPAGLVLVKTAQDLQPFVFPVVVPVDRIYFVILLDAPFHEVVELVDGMRLVIGMDAVEKIPECKGIFPALVRLRGALRMVGFVTAGKRPFLQVPSPRNDVRDTQYRRKRGGFDVELFLCLAQRQFDGFLLGNALRRPDQHYGASVGTAPGHAALHLHPLPFPLVEPMHPVGFVEFAAPVRGQVLDHPDGFLPVVGVDAGEIAVHRDDVTALLIGPLCAVGMIVIVVAEKGHFSKIAAPRNDLRKAQDRRKHHIFARQFVLDLQQRRLRFFQVGHVEDAVQHQVLVAEPEPGPRNHERMFPAVARPVFLDALILLLLPFEQPAVEFLHLGGHLRGHEEVFRGSDHFARGMPEYLGFPAPVNVASGIQALDRNRNGDIVQHVGKKVAQVPGLDAHDGFFVYRAKLDQYVPCFQVKQGCFVMIQLVVAGSGAAEYETGGLPGAHHLLELFESGVDDIFQVLCTYPAPDQRLGIIRGHHFRLGVDNIQHGHIALAEDHHIGHRFEDGLLKVGYTGEFLGVHGIILFYDMSLLSAASG